MLAALALLIAVTSPPAPQVCTFAGADEENPFKRWLTAKEVKCAPVTAADLENAARVSAMLNSGERGVIYATRSATAVPLSPDGADAVVPAGQELWLFTIGKTGPTGVFTIAPLDIGAEKIVDARQPAAPAVVGWLQVAEKDRQSISTARGLSSPSIRAGGRDGDPAPPFAVMNGAFIRVLKVEEGSADLALAGRGWIPQRRSIQVKGALTAVTEPLIASPSATLLVNWTLAPDVPDLEASLETCGAKESEPRREITVERCATPESSPRGAASAFDPASCEAIRKETIPPQTMFGSFAVDDLLPGTYRLQIAFGKLPPVGAVAYASGAQQTTVHLRAAYVAVNGNLTSGGTALPEDRMLRFPGGIGFSARKSGEYNAVLIERNPLWGIDTPVDVVTCDGRSKAVVLTDRRMLRGGRYDIDIPDNELEISVMDTFTRSYLVATVRYALMSLSGANREVLAGVIQTASPPGYARMQFVPEREMNITVSAAGYQKQELPPFTLGKSEKKQLDVQLVPLDGTSARIVSNSQFESGTIFWFARGGEETERADLAADGTFVFNGRHDSTETMAIVSRSHPLWVLRSPSLPRDEALQLPFPEGKSRSFGLAVASGPTRFFAVIVGGVRIPLPALRHHQQLRRLGWTTETPGPLPVRDIAETGQIAVIVGPTVGEVAPRAASMDLFAFPQFSSFSMKKLEPGASIIEWRPGL